MVQFINMTQIMDEEIWKTYPDYDFLEVSNLGRVRTKDRWVLDKKNGKRLIKGRFLKQQRNRYGYMYVTFRVNGKLIHISVHRAVAITFIQNPNNYPEVNHKDNDRTNNVYSNLEWCTTEYNITYKEKYGKSASKVFGKPVFAVDLKTGKVVRFETHAEAARQLGVDPGGISKVISGELYQVGGYWLTENDSEITEEKIQEIKGKMLLSPVIAIDSKTSEVFWFESQHEAARQLMVYVESVNRVIKGKLNKTGGYWFCDADENAVKKTRTKFGDEIANKVEKLINKNNNCFNKF